MERNEKENVREEEAQENSPPSPKLRKLNRRSSIATAHRMSRASAVAGISLEDQLELVPGKEEAPTLDRFKQLVNICLRHTARTVERQCSEDDNMEDEARTVSRSLLELPCILSNSKLTDLANRVDNSNIVLQPHDLQTSKMRQIREYTKRLEDEAAQWKSCQRERNRMYNVAVTNLKEAQKGTMKVDASQYFSLSSEDKKFIRSLPDLGEAKATVDRHKARQATAASRLALEATRMAARYDEMLAEIEEAALDLEALQGKPVDPRDTLAEARADGEENERPTL